MRQDWHSHHSHSIGGKMRGIVGLDNLQHLLLLFLLCFLATPDGGVRSPSWVPCAPHCCAPQMTLCCRVDSFELLVGGNLAVRTQRARRMKLLLVPALVLGWKLLSSVSSCGDTGCVQQ